MTAPALAIGWSIWQRHRRGLAAMPIYFIAAAVITAFANTLLSRDAALQIGAAVWAPLAVGAFYIAAVFAYGFDSDLATAESCFPTRMFTLPVRTAELALWPMVYGSGYLALLWIGSAGLLLRPCGFDAPLWWPALLGASQLVWAQALLWWPFGLPWLRVGTGVLLAHIPASGALLLRQYGYSDWWLTAFLGATLLFGAAAAHMAVVRSRAGAIPAWDWLSWARRAVALPRAGRHRAFASALRAQSWFEWRRQGLALPLLVAAILPFCLAGLWVPGQEPKSVLLLLACALLMPVYLAGMASGGGKNNPWARDPHTLASFIATRPLTSGELVAAKLRSAARSTLATWMLALGLVSAAIWFSGHYMTLRTLGAAWLDARPVSEVVATLFVAAFFALLLTWKRQLESQLIALTGREWLIKGNVFLALSSIAAAALLLAWLVTHPEYHGWIGDLLPWILVALAVLKFTAGAAAIRALRRRRLITERALVLGAAAWLIAFGTQLGLLRWVVPATAAATHTLAVGVALTLPLARLAAMPLALHWNRHR